ncbi:MAG: hypothetical protein K2X29_07930 [Candidatus Obscuribacterales bacterium]|nr:hypothetical protein [Candidatus Obscuribacterales bacterium]
MTERSKKIDTARRFRIPRDPFPGSCEINSLDDIPDFATAADEAKFWKNFHMSKDMLDDVPHSFDDEDSAT